MSSLTVNLKLIVCGTKGVGKSTICNGLCDLNNPIPNEYRQTKGIRILETEQDITEDNYKSSIYLKENEFKKCNIELWDMGGDKANERFWPAIKDKANGVLLIIDGKSSKHDNIIDEWINGMLIQDFDINDILCIAYNKENSKSDKQRTSNQFPKLTIYETNYDLNNLLPILHQFVDKLLIKLK